MTVRGQPGQKSSRDLIPTNKSCHSTNGKRYKIGRLWFRLALAKKQDPVSKITRAKRSGGVAQVVQHLSSNTQSTLKNNRITLVKM
jgi:hypothetical protein